MQIITLSTIIAFLVALLTFPYALKLAERYNIVDNPDARKLQRVPIPLLGGLVVFCGVLAGVICYYGFEKSPQFPLGILGMIIMLIVGTWDDMRGLSVKVRFVVEVLTVLGLMMFARASIDNLHGLWGVHEMPIVVTYILSVVAGVGIINAMNLIDGIDGYSSGYGMFACSCFALLFCYNGKPATMMIALVTAASLLPFFLHNVFGKKTKMFIGDGGTLMLGVLMTMFVFSALTSRSKCMFLDRLNFSVIAYALAILSIPVFDTLRVMIARITRGKSPFSPDKTHLHHLFIDMGFSHLGAAFTIIALNAGVVWLWYLVYKLGAPMDFQIYAVVVMGILVTFVFYKFMRTQQHSGPVGEDGEPQGTAVWKFAQRIGALSHIEKGAFWLFMRKLVDNELFKKEKD